MVNANAMIEYAIYSGVTAVIIQFAVYGNDINHGKKTINNKIITRSEICVYFRDRNSHNA